MVAEMDPWSPCHSSTILALDVDSPSQQKNTYGIT